MATSDVVSLDVVKTRFKYTDPCPVCGDEVNGFHYGILSCEACKSFFKTYVYDKVIDSCVADGNCHIDKATRRRCRFCRFQKCIMAGMKFEAVKSTRKRGGTGKFASFYRKARQQAARRHLRPNMTPLSSNTASPTSAQPLHTSIGPLTKIGDQHPHLLRALFTPQPGVQASPSSETVECENN